MRQPVAGVLALATAALDEPHVPPAALARLRLIVEQAEWLADIIAQGLEASEQPKGRAYRTDARRAAADTVNSARLSWSGEIETISASKSTLINLHPVILRRLMANLLDNAVRAAGPDGRVAWPR